MMKRRDLGITTDSQLWTFILLMGDRAVFQSFFSELYVDIQSVTVFRIGAGVSCLHQHQVSVV